MAHRDSCGTPQRKWLSPLRIMSPNEMNIKATKKMPPFVSPLEKGNISDKENLRIDSGSDQLFEFNEKHSSLNKLEQEKRYNSPQRRNLFTNYPIVLWKSEETRNISESQMYSFFLLEELGVSAQKTPFSRYSLRKEAITFIEEKRKQTLKTIYYMDLFIIRQLEMPKKSIGIHMFASQAVCQSKDAKTSNNMQAQNILEKPTEPTLEDDVIESGAAIETSINYKAQDNECFELATNLSHVKSKDIHTSEIDEDLLWKLESFIEDNHKLKSRIQQLEEDLHEVQYLREVENFAADVTISEKEKLLIDLRWQLSSFSRGIEQDIIENSLAENVRGFKDIQSLSCAKHDQDKGFSTPTTQKTLETGSLQTPSTIVNTKKRLRKYIEFLMEDKRETEEFELAERLVYEQMIEKLKSQVTEYKESVSQTKCQLADVSVEVETLKLENKRASETLQLKDQRLLESSFENENMQENIRSLNQRIEALEQTLEQERSKKKALSESESKLNQEISSLNNKLEHLQEGLGRYREQVEEQEIEIQNLKKETERKDEQLSASYTSVADMRSKLLEVENDLERIVEEKKGIELEHRSQIFELNEEISRLRNLVMESEAEKTSLRDALTNEIQDKTEFHTELVKYLEENKNLREELQQKENTEDKDRELIQMRKKVTCLETELRKKEFEYSILQNDYAELAMKMEVDKDQNCSIDEDFLSEEQRKRQQAEQESSELREELQKLTEFIKKYKERTETKLSNLKLIVNQRDVAIDELKRILHILKKSTLKSEECEAVAKRIIDLFAQLKRNNIAESKT